VSCGDNSAPYFLLNGNCTVRVSAQLSFGSGTNIAVVLDAPGCPKSGNTKGCPMTPGGSCPTGYYCTQGALPVIPATTGSLPLNINWSDDDPNATGNAR